MTSVRFTAEDFAILDALKAKLGVVSKTEILRMAIRAFAESHGVKAKKPKK